MSTERIIVDNSVIDAFADKLLASMASVQVEPGATLDNAVKVAKLVDDAVAQGARLLGGASLQRDGSRLSPCILTGVTPAMDIWSTETFAPVAILIPFESLDEAVRIANGVAYGLSASVFTRDIPRAVALAKRLESGAVHVNSMTVHDEAHLPHGGVKSSGWGRFGVPWGECSIHTVCGYTDNAGFDEFTQTKTITISDEGFGQ